MKKAALLAALLSGSALAAQTYVQDSVTYVHLEEFVKENRITMKNDMGDIMLRKGSIRLHLPGDFRDSTLNGNAFALSTPLTNIAGNIVAPLADMQIAFKLKVTAQRALIPVFPKLPGFATASAAPVASSSSGSSAQSKLSNEPVVKTTTSGMTVTFDIVPPTLPDNR